jgi:hypothetical protein
VSANTSAPQPQADQPAAGESTDYSLWEVVSNRMDELARMLSQVEMRLLMRIWKLQQRNPDGIKIDNRQLANDCHISRSGIPAALRNLRRLCLLTTRAGDTRNAGVYRACAFDAIQISGPKIGPLTGNQRPENRATVDLFSGHGGPISGPPPLDPKGLAAAAAALDFDFASLTLIDRVLSAKAKNSDAQDLQRFRRRLHGYFAKFGRDGNGRAVQFPKPPPDEIVAQFLALADPARLETMLDNLTLDAQTAGAHHPATRSAYNPYNYVWFVTIGLSRIHGIDFRVQKRARAALRDVKKHQPPEPEQLPLPDVAAIARSKAMK